VKVASNERLKRLMCKTHSHNDILKRIAKMEKGERHHLERRIAKMEAVPNLCADKKVAHKDYVKKT
jgi:hypothetical protein